MPYCVGSIIKYLKTAYAVTLMTFNHYESISLGAFKTL